jgi:hypothetical protein
MVIMGERDRERKRRTERKRKRNSDGDSLLNAARPVKKK